MDYENENSLNTEIPQQQSTDQIPEQKACVTAVPLGAENPDVPTPAESENPVQPADPQSEYHGAGVGYKETTLHTSADYDRQEDGEDAIPAGKKRKKHVIGLKTIKVAIAAVLVITLVFVGCSAAVVICNQHWQKEYDLLHKNMNEKVNALQQQLDNYRNPVNGGGTLTDPTDTLSATEIYSRNINSIVAITCLVSPGAGGQTPGSQSAGSGFIISSDGYIATNHHVIDGATKITVTLSDGSSYMAALVGSNDTNDIALLKVDAKGLKPVTIGKSNDLLVGDQVIAIGNALGQLSFSLSVGYVSGTNRDVSTDGTVINMIQTDAAINSGNSGGPLFNAKGEVIGITTAKYSGTTSSGASIEGIGFAIPMDDVIDMFNDLREYGYIRSSFLGVMVWEVDAGIAETYNLPLGVYVEEVTQGYCAEKAGVRPKDIITEIGGYKVRTMNDLTKALRNLEAGTTVTIVVWRSGIEVIMNITLDEKPAP